MEAHYGKAGAHRVDDRFAIGECKLLTPPNTMETSTTSGGFDRNAGADTKVLTGPDRFVPRNSEEAKDLYGESYYEQYCGDIPYERSEIWLKTFGDVADKLIAALNPRTVLDAGCAKGFLVEALRDRGVDARGVDLSTYALSQVREDIRPYCREGSLTADLGGPYDLVTCIEVMEHLPPSEEAAALKRLTEAADTILFSSTPENADHPTHYNVQPMKYWLKRFAALGYYPDPEFDASSLAYQAFLVRRGGAQPGALVAAYAELLEMRCQREALQTSLTNALERQQLPALNDLLAIAGKAAGASGQEDGQTPVMSPDMGALHARIELLESELQAIRSSAGWQILSRYRRWLRDVVRANPVIARSYEPVANFFVKGVSRGGKEDATLPQKTSRATGVMMDASGGGDFALHCSYPPVERRLPVSGMLTVRGWGLAQTGVERVEVHTSMGGVYAAEMGLPTPELGALHEGVEGADTAGYRCTLDAASLAAGKQNLRIVAHARDGSTKKLSRQILVDHRSPYVIFQEREAKRPVVPVAVGAGDPLISIVTPVYRTEPRLLRECVESVRRQTYPRWELCLVDDGSDDATLSALLKELVRQDERIRLQALPENHGIAIATNAGLAMASGAYVGFLDHDDVLAPVALEEVVRQLRRGDSLDVLYSDEDKLSPQGSRYEPYFKPEFSLELLRTHNYLCHFLVVKRGLLDAVGGLRPGFEGSQDYDLALRLAEKTTAVARIPQVLYHWRSVPGSTAADSNWKPEASEKGKRALEEHLARVGVGAEVSEAFAGRYRVKYEMEDEPPILVVVPAGGKLNYLRDCVEGVLRNTDYRNLRLLVADNSSGDGVKELLDGFRDPRLEWMDLRHQPFNFSRICNTAARDATEPLLLFLNDDIAMKDPGWLHALAGAAMQPGTGIAGARLLFPDGRIQHAGVVLGIGGLAGHAFRMQPGGEAQYMHLDRSTRDCTAVTGACLLTRRALFEELGGFDEAEFPVNLQDVDYCLRVQEKGQRVVWVAEAELIHAESVSRTRIDATAREIAVFRQRWQKWLDDDPYYNPNLTRSAEDYSIGLD